MKSYSNKAYIELSNIIKAFDQQCTIGPEKIAIVSGGKEYSYSYIQDLANRFCYYLIKKKEIKKGDFVAIDGYREHWVIAAIIGIIKSGAVFVPIEPSFPFERKKYLVNDSGAKIFIDKECWEEFFLLRHSMLSNPEINYLNDVPVYCIYTSGSTGNPKGVIVSMTSISNYIQFAVNTYLNPYTNNERIWLFTSLGFDFSQTLIWGALVSGRQLVMSEEEHLDELLTKVLSDNSASMVKLTPSHLYLIDDQVLQNAMPKIFVMGGEALKMQHLEILRKNNHSIIFNEYGPTEATVGCIVKKIEEGDDVITIGKPIENTDVLLLRGEEVITEPGIEGEICIGGSCLSNGYLGNEEYNKIKFPNNQLIKGGKIYRTGDIGKWTIHQELCFIGRQDEQIKIRGYRVEPGELETVLMSIEGIVSAAVLVNENKIGSTVLTAFVCSSTLTPSKIQSRLKELVPDYMMPSKILLIDKIPINENGKTDRKLLLALSSQEEKSTAEPKIIDNSNLILEELLSSILDIPVQKLVSDSDFYYLGGDSIRAIQLSSRLKKRGYHLSVSDILENPRIEDMKSKMKKSGKDNKIKYESIVPQISPIQKAFLENHIYSGTSEQKAQFLQVQSFAIPASIGEIDLKNILKEILRKHIALRTVYLQMDSKWVPKIIPLDEFPLNIDIYSSSDIDVLQYEELIENKIFETGLAFKKLDEPLIKTSVFQKNDSASWIWMVHHLNIDLFSWRIILEDLNNLLVQKLKGEKLEILSEGIDYYDWADKMKSIADTYRFKKQIPFWEEMMSGDFHNSENISPALHSVDSLVTVSFAISSNETKSLLEQFNTIDGVNTYTILLSAFLYAIELEKNSTNFRLILEKHGRESIDEETDMGSTVGWFTSLYPFKDKTDGIWNWERVKALQDQLNKIPENGVAFGYLFDLPESEISFDYQGIVSDGTLNTDAEFASLNELKKYSFIHPDLRRKTEWDCYAIIYKGEIILSVSYNGKIWESEKINSLLQNVKNKLTDLSIQIQNKNILGNKINRFTYKNLTWEEENELEKEYGIIQDILPVSSLQEGMLYHLETNPNDTSYWISAEFVLEGEIGLLAIEESLRKLVARHACTRSRFHQLKNGKFVQIFLLNPTLPFNLRNGEISKIKNDNKYFEIEASNIGFQKIKLTWRYHHLILDGWSMSNLMVEFFDNLRYCGNNKSNYISVPPFNAHIKRIEHIDPKQTKKYWEDIMGGYTPTNYFPRKINQVSGKPSLKRKVLQLSFSDKSAIKKIGASNKSTVNTFLQASWALAISILTGKKDIVFGYVTSGRYEDFPEMENASGMYINTLPLRIQLNDFKSFDEILEHITETHRKSVAYQHVQLASIIGKGKSDGLDHVFIFENYPLDPHFLQKAAADLKIKIPKESIIVEETIPYKFSVVIHEENGINISIPFDSNYYAESMIQDLLDIWNSLIQFIIGNTSERILLNSINKRFSVPEEKIKAGDKKNTSYYLFKQFVEKDPDSICIINSQQTLTYKEVDELSDHLAAWICDQTFINEEDFIALRYHRSIWQVIGILAIWKTGAAYVPIDPDLPRSRADYILSECNIKWILDSDAIELFKSKKSNLSNEFHVKDPISTRLAYCIFTSGTSGTPKGVLMEHGPIFDLVCSLKDLYALDKSDTVMLSSNISFDASVEHIWVALTSGAKLFVPTWEEFTDHQVINDLIQKHQVTHIGSVPSYLQQLETKSISGLKNLVSGGDIFKLKNQWNELNNTKIYNTYGPTEACVMCIGYQIKNDQDSKIALGFPLKHINIYIINEEGKILPPGSSGEIIIAGTCLARGYLNDAEETRNKFIDAYFNEKKIRYYKTGDIGHIAEDGLIYFSGRLDDQIKLRGFRIDPHEIEKIILEYHDIGEAVVALKKWDNGIDELLAFYTGSADILKLLEFLQSRLPKYMIPNRYIQLKSIPLTKVGKIDKQSILLNAEEVLILDEIDENKTAAEILLIKIWASVLNRPEHSLHISSNFFAEGGDSIKAMQLVSRIRQVQWDISLNEIMKNPILNEQALCMLSKTNIHSESIKYGDYSFGTMQKLFFDRYFFKGTNLQLNHYLHSVLLDLPKSISAEHLKIAVHKIFAHHDILRSKFNHKNGQWSAEVLEDETENWLWEIDELNYDDERKEKEELKSISERSKSKINITNGPLSVVHYFTGKNKNHLLISIHHLVIDIISWYILLEDLAFLLKHHSSTTLPRKTIFYGDWYASLHGKIEKNINEFNHQYENRDFAYYNHSIIVDFPDEINFMKDVDQMQIGLSELETQHFVSAVHSNKGITAEGILLTALIYALKKSTGIGTYALLMENNGRKEQFTGMDVSRSLGWFTSIYPLNLEVISDETNITAQLINVQNKLLNIPQDGIDYGISSSANKEWHPLISFNYMGTLHSKVFKSSEEGFTFSQWDHGADIDPYLVRRSDLDFIITILDDQLTLSVSYNKSRSKETTILNILNYFRSEISSVISYYNDEQSPVLFSNQYLYKNLQQSQLKNIWDCYGNPEEIMPLTPFQQGIYFHYLSNPSSTAYIMQTGVFMSGNLGIEKIKNVLNRLVRENAALRIAIPEFAADSPIQIIKSNAELNFNIDNISELKAEDQINKIREWMYQDRVHGFKLDSEPLIRFSILLLSKDKIYFQWTYHHIILDGWSLSILINDFFIYLKESDVNVHDTYQIKPSFTSYIKWLSNQKNELSIDFWRNYLYDYKKVCVLPSKNINEHSFTEDNTFIIEITQELSDKLQSFATENNITLSLLMQATWGILLAKYNDSQDAVFGYVHSGRSELLEDMESIVGALINTVPVRIKFGSNTTYLELINELREHHIHVRPHLFVGLSEIQSLNEHGSALINHLMLFENYPLNNKSDDHASIQIDDKNIFSYDLMNYDFSIALRIENKLHIGFRYNHEKYPLEYVKEISEHWKQIWYSLLQNPKGIIQDESIFSKEQIKSYVELSKGPEVSWPPVLVLDVFQQHAKVYSDSEAVCAGERILTYKELDLLSNQLAAHLELGYNVEAGDFIGLKINRTEWCVIAYLAIWKCRCVVVPVDGNDGSERSQQMFRDSSCKIVIDEDELELFKLQRTRYTQYENKPLRGSDIAYCIHTSGSTGKPKGVLVSHDAFALTVWGHIKNNDVLEKLRQLAFASLSFDVSVLEMFVPLVTGGSIVMANEHERDVPELLEKLIIDKQVSIAYFTPSMMNLLSEKCLAGIRILYSGGEVANSSLLSRLSKYNRCINVYGPTEAAIAVTFYELEGTENGKLIPLGKPMPGKSIYLMDQFGNPSPLGAVGEICIGGFGLSDGYLNSEESHRYFISSENLGGEKIYRTGDLGKWDHKGQLLFIGRKDDQIKIRGQRVESSEILEVVLQHQSIKDGAIYTDKEHDHIELVLFYIGDINEEELRTWLLRKLPSHMIPARLIAIDRIPINKNGKIDFNALKLNFIHTAHLPENNVTLTKLENELASCWSLALEKEINLHSESDFFLSGGHSIKAIQLVNIIFKRFQLKLELKDVFEYSRLSSMARKLEILSSQQNDGISKVDRNISDHPLSPAQKRLWILHQVSENVGISMMSQEMELKGEINLDILGESHLNVVRMHEALRIYLIVDKNGEPRQKLFNVFDEESFESPFRMVVVHSEADKINFINKWNKSLSSLIEQPLTLLIAHKINHDTVRITFMQHHIISDGISAIIYFKNLINDYNDKKSGIRKPSLKNEIEFIDYVHWQNNQLKSGKWAEHKQYWLNKFKGQIPLLELSTGKHRPTYKKYNGSSVNGILDVETLLKFSESCNQSRATLFMGLSSAVQITLYLLNGQNEIVIGTPVSGREKSELESVIGLFMNMLPIKLKIDSNLNWDSHLKIVRSDILDDFGHQIYPFDQLLPELEIDRDFSRNPLFDVVLVLQGKVDVDHLNLPVGISIVPIHHHENSIAFDLYFSFSETSEGLEWTLIYDTELFDKIHAEAISNVFKDIIKQVSENPEIIIDDIKVKNEIAEKKQSVDIIDHSTIEIQSTFIDQFENCVLKYPFKIACVCGYREYTYQELDFLSNRFAYYLMSKVDVKKDDIVALKLQKSEWLMISILGIMKSGAAYLPIDADGPESRNNWIIQDSKAIYCVTDEDISSFQENISSWTNSNVDVDITPEHLSYCIYTSGSTGKPKGVLMEHGAIASRLNGFWKSYGFSSDERIYQSTVYTFDISVLEILLPLMTGSTVIMPHSSDYKDPGVFIEECIQCKVTSIHVVPSWLEILNIYLESDSNKIKKLEESLVRVIVCGEILPLSVVQKWYSLTSIPIYNLYGPTEAAVYATGMKIEQDCQTVPIGLPLPDTDIIIMGESGKTLPHGFIGEILISGKGLAREYLRLPELTNQVFIYSNEARIKMYRTGDLGRWNDNGLLEFWGRKDDQVKIQGHRIELAEVESIVSSLDGIGQVKIIMRDGDLLQKELIAFYIGNGSSEFFHSMLVNRLPHYMIPSKWVKLEQMPLSDNGKLDRKALIEIFNLQKNIEVDSNIIGTKNQKLRELWAEVLEIELNNISFNSNFFKLGGSSIKAILLANKIKNEYHKKINIKDIFLHASFNEMSKMIKRQLKEKEHFIPHANEKDIPLTLTQKLFWLNDCLSPNENQPTLSLTVNINGKLDIDIFKDSYKYMMNRHEILRMYVDDKSTDDPCLKFIDTQDSRLDLVYRDISFTDELSIKKVTADYLKNYFNVEEGPLIRCIVLKIEDEKYKLILDAHHLVMDAWSYQIFTKELVEVYDGLLNKKNTVLADLHFQFKDFAYWQYSQIHTEGKNEIIEFWTEKFKTPLSGPIIPSYLIQPIKNKKIPSRESGKFSSEAVSVVRELSVQHGLTIRSILLSGLLTVLKRVSTLTNFVIGTPYAERNSVELENQIGCYISILPMRFDVQESDFKALCKYVMDKSAEYFDHSLFPYDDILSLVNKNGYSGSHPFFEIWFDFQNFTDQTINTVPSLTIEIELSEKQPAVLHELSFIFDDNGDDIAYIVDHDKNKYSELFLSSVMESIDMIFRQGLSSKNIGQLPVQYFNPIEGTITEQYEGDIIGDFCNVVYQSPDLIALKTDENEFTFNELHIRAIQFSHHLRKYFNIQEGNKIIVSLPRNESSIIAMLGIWFADAVYIPVDPNLPDKRKEFIQNDSGASIVITEEQWDKFILIRNRYETNFDKNIKKIDSKQIAYIIYTSGSTGLPKGVVVSFGAVYNTIRSFIDFFDVKDGYRHAQFSSLSFDASLAEMLVSLLGKGILYFIPEKAKTQTNILADFILNNKIDIIILTPGFISLLPMNCFQNLKTLVSAGDAMTTEINEKLPANVRLINAYGPTETAICASMYLVDRSAEYKKRIPIGKPISNTKVLIVDDHLKPMPRGWMGEILISGIGLSNGYHGNSELTTDKFIKLNHSLDEIWYRTSDYGLINEKGELEYLGRFGKISKIRGFRIELEEIKNSILKIKGVDLAHILVVGPDLESLIIAIFEGTVQVEQIIQHLKAWLPDYMMPNRVIKVDFIPLNANGKIDEKEILKIIENHQDTGVNENFISPTETWLKEQWSHLLSIPQHSIKGDSDFFRLGGHSLKVLKLTNSIQKHFHLKLQFEDVIDNSTFKKLVSIIENGSKFIQSEIPFYEIREAYPMSPAQLRIWMVCKLQFTGEAYHLYTESDYQGKIDVPLLIKTLRVLCIKHEILRTVFVENQDNLPVQIIHDSEKIDYEQLITFKKGTDQDIVDFQTDWRKQRFEFSIWPLFRILIIDKGESNYCFALSMHHIIGDGWSIQLFLDEFLDIYKNFSSGVDNVKSVPVRQYRDYSIWINEYIKSESYTSKISALKEYIGEECIPLEFPEQKSINQRSFVANVESFFINWETTELLINDCIGSEGTLFMGIVSMVHILLAKYTGQHDIIIGSPVSGRTHADTENILGCFINLIPIRNVTHGDLTWHDVLQKVIANVKQSFSFQDIPFEEMVKSLNLSRELEHHPLFNVLIVFDESLEELKSTTEQTIPSKFDLHFHCQHIKGKGLKVSVAGCSEIFSPSSMKGFSEAFVTIFNEFKSKRDLPIHKWEMAENIEKIISANSKKSKEITNSSILPLNAFNQIAHQHPYKKALVSDDLHIDFDTLNKLSNEFALELQSIGIGKGDHVALYFEPSVEMIVSILSVWKIGAAFIPLDPEIGITRAKSIIDDINPKVLVHKIDEHSIEDDQVRLISIDLSNLKNRDNEVNWPIILPDDVAYVIYTSGSSGAPKGVMVTHSNLANYASWWVTVNNLDCNADNVLLSSFGFDSSYTNILSSFYTGSTLHLLVKEKYIDNVFIKNYILKENIQWIKCTPTYFRSVLLNDDDISDWAKNLKMLVLGGEESDLNDIKKFWVQFPSVRIMNHYGPTEATIGCAAYIVNKKDVDDISLNKIPIGSPVSGNTIVLLNAEKKALPLGLTGEISVIGKNVSKGYFNNVDFTNKRFVENIFDEKVYLTGDFGRWNEEGKLIYLGRKDEELKINGYRIAKEEIRKAFMFIPEVNDVFIDVILDESNRKIIIAVVATNRPHVEIRNDVSLILSPFMLPERIICIKHIPMNDHGKIDKNKLKEIILNNIPKIIESVYESKDIKEIILHLIKRIINSENINSQLTFFQNGGNSLNAIQFVSRLKSEYGYSLSFIDLFKSTSIEQLIQKVVPVQVNDEKDYLIKFNQLNDSVKEHLFYIPPIIGQPVGLENLLTTVDHMHTWGIPFHSEVDFVTYCTRLILSKTRKDEIISLIGYSAGGNVAFEICRLLEKESRKIGKLVLIDSRRKLSPTLLQNDDIDKEIRIWNNNEYFKKKIGVFDFEKFSTQIKDYILYNANLINNGMIQADIILITSEKDHGELEDYEWRKATTGNHIILKGSGSHVQMLMDDHIAYNIQILREVFNSKP